MNRTSSGRIWEIDVLRGTALLLMIFFHLLFDLKEIYGYPVNYNQGLFYVIGKISAIMFIMISAVSSSLSSNNLRRAVKMLLVAAVITIVTHLYDPVFGVKFGIIHFLGLSTLLYPIFRNLNKYLLILLGILMVSFGLYLDKIPAKTNYLFLFNLTGAGWSSADYYPLLPWFGVFLFGISLGKTLYPDKKSLFECANRAGILALLGRHTLLLYLVHQPLLIVIIAVFRKITV